jgi:hypothetical protein
LEWNRGYLAHEKIEACLADNCSTGQAGLPGSPNDYAISAGIIEGSVQLTIV